jgi:hypothetical protein
MSMLKNRAVLLTAAMFLSAIFTPMAALACCPDGGGGAPKVATKGLGQSTPTAMDLTTDLAWHIYEFHRDGITYTQINDVSGTVRAAIGRIGTTMWVLPIGSDAERVALPGDPNPSGQSKSLYRSNEIEVVLVRDGGQDRWVIRSTSSGH